MKKIFKHPFTLFLILIIVLYTIWIVYNNIINYIEYTKLTEPYVKQAKIARAYAEYAERAKKEEYEMLKNDTYGGKTPEETLKLFVDALKNKDAKLASKYYFPWDQDRAYADLKDWMDNYPEGLSAFIEAYNYNNIKRDTSYAIGLSLDIYPENVKYPYSVKMQLNKVNNIWKISEF